MTHSKFLHAEKLRDERRRNWILVSKMRKALIEENRHVKIKRQQISEALKETIRINHVIRQQKEKFIEEQKEKFKKEVEFKFRKRLAEESKDLERLRQEVMKKKLQQLLNLEFNGTNPEGAFEITKFLGQVLTKADL